MNKLYDNLPQHLQDQVIRVRSRLLRACGKLPFAQELYVTMTRPGTAIDAPRRCGKTEAILWTVSNIRHGDAIIVAMNDQHTEQLRRRYHENYEGTPLFISASRIERVSRALDGLIQPLYCDEWFHYSHDARTAIAQYYNRNGRVVALGSYYNQNPNEPTFECYPLL